MFFLLVIFKLLYIIKLMLKKVDDKRGQLVQWLKDNFSQGLAEHMKNIDAKWLPKKACTLAAKALDGKELNEKERNEIIKESDGAYRKKERAELSESTLIVNERKKPAKPKKSIQEIMIAKAMDCQAELEGYWDEYIDSEIKANQKFPKFRDYMKLHNVLPQHIHIIKEEWIVQKEEIDGALNGVCEQLVEGYSNYNKNQLKNMSKYCEAVLQDCDTYVEWKKSSVKPRKKQLKTPAQMVKKLQYCESHDELKLKSIDPADIVRATQIWVYNVKNRKLQYYKAEENSGFIVKGTTLSGYHTTESQQKTLRKPAETLKKIKVASKDNAKMAFDLLKTTGTACNGRFNKNLVIIKAN